MAKLCVDAVWVRVLIDIAFTHCHPQIGSPIALTADV
jgi:hypothetical protein